MRQNSARDPQDRRVFGRRPYLLKSRWKGLRFHRVLIVVTESVCVAWLVLTNILARPYMSDMVHLSVLVGITGLYAEVGARIERVRRFVANTTFSNASSLWCFAAALTLPLGLAGAFATALYGHILWRGLREKSARAVQLVYTAATEVLATMSAATVLARFHADRGHLGGVLGAAAVVMALLSYAVVNQGLVTAVIYRVTRPARIADVMLSREDEILEVATLGLAVLFAVTLVNAPLLSPFTLLLIVVLRRSALVRELQVQAMRDAKTGLLNAGGWRQEADREVVRAERLGGELSVLMVDLDHFKNVNDSYGHPAGDAALAAIADCLRDALRGYDAVGRFGGEEFIALLADADQQVSRTVAERLCVRIRCLELGHGGTVSASIGVGVGIAGTHSLDELIAVADKALYLAKASGRDQVQLARAGPVRASTTTFIR